MKTNLPTQSSSHKKEKLSRIEFERMIGDWIIFHFNQVEYGIDAQVEITHSRLGTEDNDVTNIRFSVQLKSTQKLDIKKGKISFSGVPITKINYWCRGNLPTLFVVYDLSKENFYYRWIDVEFINDLDKTNPNWRNRETTTIEISEKNKLSNSKLSEIADYVNNYKRSHKRIIPSGTFFEIKKSISSILSSVQDLNKKYSFESITSRVLEIDAQLDKAMYKVTITGQTKAGKSSFINAMLHRYISSEDFLPLTGIPINFIPGKEEYSEIVYLNGKKVRGTVEESYLRKFISKTENKGNTLGVSMVNVIINNHQLENGVSLSDVPGIDDLEKQVQNYTWSTIDQSNAILYMIDAFPYEGGGQVFNYSILQDLKRLEKIKGIDKVFVLFNKIDRIKTNPISKLKTYIETTFEENEIRKIVHSKIFYISAKDSYGLRKGVLSKGVDTVKLVEEELWGYIINENKIGIYKFQKMLSDINIMCANYSSMANVVLSEDSSFRELKKAIASAKKDFPTIERKLTNKKEQYKTTIRDYVNRRNDFVVTQLSEILNKEPNIPSIEWVREHLKQSIQATITASNEWLGKEYLSVKNEIDGWVEENLKKIRKTMGNDIVYDVDVSNLNDFAVENLNDLNVTLGVINVGLLALLAIEFPPLAIILGILSLIGWAASANERKQNQVNRIIAEVQKQYRISSDNMSGKYDSSVYTNIHNLYKYGEDRLNLFLNDIENEITKRNVNPISVENKAVLENNLTHLEKINRSVEKVDNTIKLNFF